MQLRFTHQTGFKNSAPNWPFFCCQTAFLSQRFPGSLLKYRLTPEIDFPETLLAVYLLCVQSKKCKKPVKMSALCVQHAACSGVVSATVPTSKRYNPVAARMERYSIKWNTIDWTRTWTALTRNRLILISFPSVVHSCARGAYANRLLHTQTPHSLHH